MSRFLGPSAMPALRACLALACVVLGVTTLPDGVSAGTQPTTGITVTNNAAAARDPGAPHGPVVLPHDTDEDADPHKLLIEPPAAPAGLTGEQGRVDGEVQLSWDAPAPTDDIEHHDYRYHTGGRYSAWITIPASGSSSNQVGYVNSLTGGVAHTFQVRAVNTNGDPSLPSATATATPRGGAAARGATTPTKDGAGGDPAGVVVTLELSPSLIGEGSEVSTVTASLDSASATPLTVTVSAAAVGPAAPEDFTLSANQTLEIEAGDLTSTGTVTITANDNTVDAPDKDVTVSGTVAGATDVTGPSDVTLTITDDDGPVATTCTGGSAGVNLCSDVDLMSYLAMNDIGGGVGVDIWGWTDSSTGKEYAIMGRSTGTAFVDISDPLSPIYLGDLPPHSGNSQWRDIKVYLDHAFIVTEASNSGMQVFDLTQLRTVSSPPVTFSATAHYSGFSDAHNIAINEDSGFAYAVGTDTCEGGLHMINIQSPTDPTWAGCFSDDGYTHDAQCVNYIGPDPDHPGAEICFNSNTDTLTIVDVTNKAAPEMLGRAGYTGSGYTHQGWLTEDHVYFVLGDEFDELRDPSVTGTTTYLWDVSDLGSPTLVGTHVSTATRAIDHNQFVKGKYTYQSNYQAGLRILDVTDIANGNLTEVAFFDMVPDADSPQSLEGTWGNYPFFDSGIVIVSVRTQGLFILRPNLVDRIQPKVGRATVDRETLTLTYGEALDETSEPALDAFAVTVEGTERSVSGVSVSGRAVTLTLSSAVTVAQEVTVTYTVPGTNPTRDEAENNAPSLSSREVRNDTTGPPGTPTAPTVTAASATSLTVIWAEPPNAKPPITDYDVQYRVGSSGNFTDWPHAGTALTATILSLTEGTTYQVQVLARNPEGASGWSTSGSGTPAPPPNTAPTASAMATTPTTVNGLGRVTLDGRATDPDGDGMTYAWTSSGGGIFDDASALDTWWTAPAKTNAAQDIVLTVTVTDDGTEPLTHAAEVNVRVRENQRPTASVSPDTATVDGRGAVTLLGMASDPDTTTLTYAWTSSGGGTFNDASALDTTWTAPPKTDAAQDITLTLTVTDDGFAERAATVTVEVTVRANRAPAVAATATTPTTVNGGDEVTLRGTATDPDGDNLEYAWSSSGGGSFDSASVPDTTWTAPATTAAVQNITLTLTVTEDSAGRLKRAAEVRVTVRGNQPPPVFTTTGGGGGGGGGPTPSVVDFEWNVKRDIEELDSGHEVPTGAWSDHTTLWLAHNGDGAHDAVYAYDLKSGKRVADREFELDNANRAPRGVWSDRNTIWVSDSGKDKLFAHDLESGERLPDSDLALHPDNDDGRGIWSDNVTMWVLDRRDDALFGYDLASGELLAEYALDDANDDPRGIFSDGATVWVSNHDPKRLFAYRLPSLEEAAGEDEDAEDLELERITDEEFTKLGRASNNSPRGIWSDGDVMYVADESDARVYSYNMPDALDARLASLTLSEVDFGEFSSDTPEYEGVADEGVTQTTVEAMAVQTGARVAIDPPDADEDADGRQAAVADGTEVTVTVTSTDGSRTKIYRVRIGGTAGEEQSVAACLRGAVTVGFSLLVYEGGSVEDLAACAQTRGVTALYVLHEGEYVPYTLGAPDLVNEEFVALFPTGLPALTPLIAESEGPPSPAPEGDDVPEFGPDCLRGEIASGFSLVLYAGGSVDDLDTCAEGRDVSAGYALVEGEYVPYIIGAPEFVNRRFRELFPGGLPPITALVAQREAPSADQGDGGS